MIKPTKPLLAGLLVLGATQAQATLTNYTANGQEVVYSSVSDVTWTKDANLLGSMFASQGFDTVVNAIIAASPTIANTPNAFSPSGVYTLTVSDFNSDGQTNWFGAMAYVNYLNSINYGGSKQWRLPLAATQNNEFNTPSNGSTAGNELSELFYQELGSRAGDSIINTSIFDDEQTGNYWFGTEYARSPKDALVFGTGDGYQNDAFKSHQFYAWAVSPGRIGVVPEPESIAMLLLGLSLVGGVVRRRRGLCLPFFA